MDWLQVFMPTGIIGIFLILLNQNLSSRIKDLRDDVKRIESKLDMHIQNYDIHKSE